MTLKELMMPAWSGLLKLKLELMLLKWTDIFRYFIIYTCSTVSSKLLRFLVGSTEHIYETFKISSSTVSMKL
jgi:hypothetical protein